MKQVFFTVLLLSSILLLHAAGVVINSGSSTFQAIKLLRCAYDVDIHNQIAVVTVKETFKNLQSSNVAPRYYYPLAEGCSATQLRWYSQGFWWQANISPNPSSAPGGPSTLPSYFTNYVGSFPIVFDFTTVLFPQDTLAVELTYVQLLPYTEGNVDLSIKNNYTPISTTTLLGQTLDVELNSTRNITSFLSLNQVPNSIEHSTNHGICHYAISNAVANTDYHLRYSLDSSELGLWSVSTYRDSVPDNWSRGFFTFIAEPDPSNTTQIINKVFTLIIDRSGSMSGTKITQAKQAASYIVNHLNEGDQFNIVQFNESNSAVWNSHQQYNPTNAQTALNFINNISASGMTNIGSAFLTAIPQFNNTSNETANIIIFLTDGCPTAGITDTQQLRTYIHNLMAINEATIYLYNFGIGINDVNTQLLTQTSTDNHGLVQFLGQDDVYTSMTSFYNIIRNPVLLDPVITVDPANAVEQMFPSPLPNLYIGKQMIVSGRYNTPQTVHLTFSGHAFSQTVTYDYDMILTEANDPNNAFLTKIWAKQKIDNLLIQYYGMDTTSTTAHELKQTIIEVSMTWGVITPFTSFHGGNVPNEDPEAIPTPQYSVKLLGNFPNPFNPVTYIRFEITKDDHMPAYVRIYNVKGQLIKVLGLITHGKGAYQVMWDGTDQQNKSISSGVYFYTLEWGNEILTGKMIMLK
jgi:Ca-activated chloride channel homolog